MTDTTIIGVSGKKQSGKSLLCEDLLKKYSDEDISIKVYSFADALKQKVCMEVLGLTYEQCNGTDEQKNTKTVYKWETLPKEIRYHNKLGFEFASNGEVSKFIYPEGYMTAREVMQIVGTDIFRKYFDDDVWVNATLREIKKDNVEIALISDARFPSEVDSIIDNGGYVIRLLRDVCEKDSHASETALDDYDFSTWGNRVCVINNQNMSIEDKNKIVFDYLEGVLTYGSRNHIS